MSSMNEKGPILPSHQDGCHCYEEEGCKHNSVRTSQRRLCIRSFVSRFFQVLILCAALYGTFQWIDKKHVDSGKDVDSQQKIVDMNGFNSNVALTNDRNDAHLTYLCKGELTLPLKGDTNISIDASIFNRLEIKQRAETMKGYQVELANGKTTVRKSDDAATTTVTIKINGNDPELADIFWIEQNENPQDGRYEIVIHQEENFQIQNGCVSIDVDVVVPESNSLKSLRLMMASNKMLFLEGLDFADSLDISTANGDIEFEKGISSGRTNLRTANGRISGTLRNLYADLSFTTANGVANVRVEEISPSKEEKAASVALSGSTANGSIKLQLPSHFESQFSLTSFTGRRIVEVSEPKKLHINHWSWGSTKGYYGDSPAVKDRVSLTAANGNLDLLYNV
ncbi:hypothetical protein BDF20DRAFT_913206 [Mycotypha africana]|uniref:uncharacterized protein n=1 Tax=Mycotypha africana TaxID=64632 RepID=UPI0023009EB2|nr:uncharacterized protein BDF20DRAFT_913206 [Mycotypha africana]KAI8979674.1 hypothetical protein BDF20DRAFT_913206 [Mycotypha africana]